ncbi:MAG: sigma-54-dependent Fis family transcriptional regulator, partial [Myxococcales bacterium]|nr:sigma-54-dependent Fis family transcriptional regulator [Myxococcales bacterium]
DRRRRAQLVGICSALGGMLVAFLCWPDGFLADRVFLPFGLLSLCLWRPVVLALHHAQRQRGERGTNLRIGAYLPSVVLLLASIYGWSRTLVDHSETPLDAYVYDQLNQLVLVAAGLAVGYHLLDLVLHGRYLKRLNRRLGGLTFWAMVLSCGFLLGAIVDASQDLRTFLDTGYAFHLAGFVAVQWLGDFAQLHGTSETRLPSIDMGGPGIDLAEHVETSAPAMGLYRPYLAVRMRGADVLLIPGSGRDRFEVYEYGVDDEIADPDANGANADTVGGFSFEPLGEKLAGLLELLDAEGGMFPRFKTERMGEGESFDPFDGLDQTVGVELVLPLTPRPDLESGEPPSEVDVYLVSDRPDEPDVLIPRPSSEDIQQFQAPFQAPQVLAEVRALAAQAALTLRPQAETTRPEVEPRVVARVEVERQQTIDKRLSAAVRYHDRALSYAYPTGESELLSDELRSELGTLVQGRGALLLQGEMGTGREFVARWIHSQSAREGAFVSFDCASIPSALIPSELAGEDDLVGLARAAEGGTLCLRGLGECDEEIIEAVLTAVRGLDLRLTLLERDGSKLSPAILREVDEAKITLPPLRECGEHILVIAEYYLHRFAMERGKIITGISEKARVWLQEQAWPTNVRSLKSAIRDGIARESGSVLTIESLGSGGADPIKQAAASAATQEGEDLRVAMEDLERQAIIKAMEEAEGNKSRAARILGMKRTTFIRKWEKYGTDFADGEQ